jgi:type I restriction enzyme S subunit
MAGEWRKATLADVVALQRGHDLPEDQRLPGKVPVMGSFGVTGYHNEARARGPGVTVGRSGASFGETSYIEVDYWPLNTCMYVTDFKGNNPKFCYFLLKTIDFAGYNSGSAQPSLNRNFIYPIKLHLPPRDEQNGIANLLASLDDKIETNRRMAATLEEMARALFKSWFVDFDPVRAKIEGRDTGLPAANAALFPDRFDKDGLPSGWTMRKVADGCSTIFSGGTPSTGEPDFWNGALPWFSSGETRHRFVTDTEKKITRQAVDNSSTRLARRGSTVIASAGQGNTRGQTSFLLLDTHINQSVVALQADASVSTDLFLFFDLERRYDEFRRVSDGQSSRGSLTTKLIGGLPAVLPTRSIVDAFDRAVQPFMDRIESALAQTKHLRAVRDTLLPKLISGELRVKDVSDDVEAA